MSTAELLGLAVEAAVQGGATLLHHYGRATGVDTKSGAHDPVSDADREAEAVIVAHLRAARPDDGLLGEEGAKRTGSTGLTWVLDPLDGTTNYLYGHPGWAVSVAAVDDRGGVVGVVHDPLRGETFTARRDAGAWLGETRLRVNDPVRLADALVAAGFSFNAADRLREGPLIAALLPRIRDLRPGGSVALGLAWTAAARVDAFFQNRSSPWDWAAGVLLVAEARRACAPRPAHRVRGGRRPDAGRGARPARHPRLTTRGGAPGGGQRGEPAGTRGSGRAPLTAVCREMHRRAHLTRHTGQRAVRAQVRGSPSPPGRFGRVCYTLPRDFSDMLPSNRCPALPTVVVEAAEGHPLEARLPR